MDLELSRRCRLAAAAAALATAAIVTPAVGSDVFPEPEAIRPNVEFWVGVFAEWGVGQVVVHDMDYPGLYYEVADLPGPVEPKYTEEQREFVDDVRERWEEWLRSFEAKVAAGDPLDELEQRWLEHIDATIGLEALPGAHERVRTQRGLRERFRGGLERSARYLSTIRSIFREAGLPEDLAYLPHVESSFVANARSSAGAVGLWQFTRGTGKLYMKVTSTIDERLDPIVATHGAAAYLGGAYEKLESWPLALTSYNHGVHGMMRAKKEFGTDFAAICRNYRSRSFGFASRNFYAEFLAVRRIAGNPDRYFPEGWQPESAVNHDRAVTQHRRTPTGIANAYGVDLTTLVSLNPAWSKRAVQRSLRLPVGTTVWLPPGTLERIDPAAAAAAEPFDGSDVHIVRRGDTLSEIAVEHGLSVAELRELNGIPRGSSLLRIGQELVLGRPAAGRDVHVVRPGETLSEIAAAHRVDLAELRAVNEIGERHSLIRAGQKLRLPMGARSPSQPTAVHVVRNGDTLIKIATRHGVRLMDLLTANSLTATAVIHPGQSIRIPSH